MPPIVNTIEIDRPPEVVFAYVTDPRRFPEWQRDVVSVRMEADAEPAVDVRFTTTRRVGRSERIGTQRITECRPPHAWACRGIDGPVRAHATIDVEPLRDGAASRVTFGLELEGRGPGRALAPGIRRIARKGAPLSHRAAKELLESAPPEPTAR
ncbi:SRPBCC family protein [Streptomyces sp. A7024]|uniref:SRPBCC family protein n=1 Tax=Streptomyces coryli TaxID=1128680 RepID=A0A6G4TWN9_9ACTN|nr:SRPBCC family protein [Streptomyces coryli]NGN63528.1 SRPBCC family protein [Streptomyces coryli]